MAKLTVLDVLTCRTVGGVSSRQDQENPELESLLVEQAGYYRERAGEYDDWWFRRGRYDHGAEASARWRAEVQEVESALDQFEPGGDVLELACGTGLWTRRLAPHARTLSALDASPEVLELARARVDDPHVSFLRADLFVWEPQALYDVCFFGFWLSHVPEERFESFWGAVRRALRPTGRVFFVDSLRSDVASAVDHVLPEKESQTMLRRLADGREYHIVKRFYEPSSLEQRLAQLGWSARVQTTAEFFLFGQAAVA
jgi:demethylmenaquinone methyltransferase/2-methoxy-6-polyprenyl-1,4-benzoquinol methylase